MEDFLGLLGGVTNIPTPHVCKYAVQRITNTLQYNAVQYSTAFNYDLNNKHIIECECIQTIFKNVRYYLILFIRITVDLSNTCIILQQFDYKIIYKRNSHLRLP